MDGRQEPPSVHELCSWGGLPKNPWFSHRLGAHSLESIVSAIVRGLRGLHTRKHDHMPNEDLLTF